MNRTNAEKIEGPSDFDAILTQKFQLVGDYVGEAIGQAVKKATENIDASMFIKNLDDLPEGKVISILKNLSTEQIADRLIALSMMQLMHKIVDIWVLPGGRKPERKSPGAIGFDTYCRALVSETEKDENDSRLRKTIFDFKNVPGNPWLQEHIVPDPNNQNKWAYNLRPGEHVLIGVGFATAFEDMMYWLTPRSGLSMQRLTLTNAPGTVDPDYRGEAGALLVNQSEKDYLIKQDMRIAQAVFCPVYIPELIERETIDELGSTERGGGGFGSTGLYG